MQIIKFFDGSKKLLADDEAENVKRMWIASTDEPIELRDGSVISPKSISGIGEPERIATWGGYALSKGGTSFMRDGERVYLEPEDFKQIEYRLHPKYGIGMPEVEKPKILSSPENIDQPSQFVERGSIGGMRSIGSMMNA